MLKKLQRISAILCVFFITQAMVFPNYSYGQCNITDWEALQALYVNTDGGNWTNNTGWEQVNPAVNPSSPSATCDLETMYGITLDMDGRISTINLSNNNLSGSIPQEIGDLVPLTSFILNNNNLTGSIPSSFAQLTNLTQFNISNNALTGCYDASLSTSNSGGDALESGGTTYVRPTSNTQVVTNFDPAKDKIDVGTESIHTQIVVDGPNGLTFQNMFNQDVALVLEGIFLKDLQWFNFEPIADAHLQQDLSAALAYENCTGLSRPNTVYIRSHEPDLVEEVDFNPATDKVSFFYMLVRGDEGVNFAVEQTNAGARFYSPYTGQSMTLKDIQFSELNSSHFEFRANQLEDNLAGRMGLDDVISNFQIDNDNVYNGKSVAMAGGIDRAPYHIYAHDEYTGTPICENSSSVLCNFSNAVISSGNNFDEPWEDFCASGAGTCVAVELQAPVVTINSPSNGANLQLGNGITINVEAVDNDGTITSLDILANDLMLSSNNTLGNIYEATWTPTAVGTYTLNVTATDNDNQTTTESISVTVSDNSIPQCNTADWAALQAFYASTDGANWTNNTGWEQVNPATYPTNPPATCDLADLYGISLNADGRVIGINLSNNNLTGSIPTEIGGLGNLTSLVLNNNNLLGSLPAALARLTNLTQFNISDNSLSGCYDASLGASGNSSDALAAGGTTYVRSTTENQVVTDFDPTKDKIDVGSQSIHTQIMLDGPDGLTFESMFNPNGKLILEGIFLKDLQWFNFEPIADAHFQQDISAALAYENCTGLSQANTVYVRSHEPNLVEEVDFNPATDKVSFFYLCVRGDEGVNFAVEQTNAGARFYSPYTGQSMTLKDVQFSDLNNSHFEWRANQLEDNLAGRMGLDDVISNFQIDNDNVYNGKSVAMAGGVDRAPYHIYAHDEYTGSLICEVGNSVLCNFSNATISNGNDFDEPWEDFCASSAGICEPTGEPEAPVVTISSPSNGATLQLGGNINISANAVDNDGAVTNVSITVNDLTLNSNNTTGNTYTATWTPTSVGTYTIAVTATDDDNKTTSESISVTVSDNSTPQCNTADWAALQALYVSTDGANWTNNTGWEQVNPVTYPTSPPATCDLADLYGISLNADGRVIGISLTNNNLTGGLPTEIGDLGNLTSLVLDNNNLSGNLPAALARLTNLTQLNLSDNSLSGCYDASLGASSNSSDALAAGGTTYVRSTTENQVVTDFDPTKDKIEVGSQSIHTQIMLDGPDGLTFESMFNPSGKLILEGIFLKDLQWFNFEPIADAHFQQDISAALAYENCTGLSQANTVYVRSHEPNLVEEVDFNPATDRVSFFYLCVRGDEGVNFAVEQTNAGARFYSPYTGQSLTLKNVLFSDLNSSHFEFRANQLEDNLAGRMGLDDVISNFQIDNDNVYNGKSVAMAGGVDRAPYHIYAHDEYTGSPICEVGSSILCNFSNATISNGNNFDEPWEDFCASEAGTCVTAELQAPVVTINSPSNGANLQLGNEVTINVEAVDNDGTITSLDIMVNDLMLNSSNTSGNIYAATWTSTSVGTFTINVTATDNDNQTTTESISLTVSDNSIPQCNTADWEALQALYASTDGANWTNNTGWDQVNPATYPTSPPATCDLADLYGITLNADGRVIGINLSNNNLNGSIPIEIGDLGNLTSLVLNNNNLLGSLPAALARLTNLTQFNIADNSLSGCYDASLGASGNSNDALAAGGTTYVRSTTENQVVTDFDPTKDKIEVGSQSIHTQIMLDGPDGLTFENMFNPNGKLILEGIFLKDLQWFNFEPIADAHFQQDISAALAYENCSGLSRPNTVYVRSHEPNLVEEVDFNPATDKVSFFYLCVRGDEGVNFAVEQTNAGARFYSPYTGQSMTLKDVQFSELNNSHFEWRANQLEDNLAGRMGLDDVISNFQIDNDNVFNGKSVLMAGGVDQAPYHIYSHDEYTGSPICEVGNSVLCNFSNATISNGNNFDEPWEDFCASGAGTCEITVEPEAPVVTINSPSNGATLQLGGMINISVNAVDNDGSVTNVSITVNDLTLNSNNTIGNTYEAAWTPGSVGTYTITVIATDNDNLTRTESITVMISDDPIPPTITINTPYNGATLELGNSVAITAAVSDSDGSIVSVIIDIDGSSITSSNTNGNTYEATWTPVNTGTYTITVTATDDDNEITARSVTVTISDDPPPTGDYNYGEVLQKSLFFYEAQQSGELPAENRVHWRGDSGMEDGADVSLGLTGGWYDAGDHVKFGFPMAYTATVMAWSGVEDQTAYENMQQWAILKNNLRFVNDYFIKCHVRNGDGSTNKFYGQVGNGSADHAWWGPAEVMQMNRPAYYVDANNPGSDLTGETAAALAAASMIFANDDPTYSAELLEHAIALYNFADTYRGKYSDAITDASAFYNSWSGYQDELVWGAIWLYRATGDTAWLTKAQSEYLYLSTEQGSTDKSYHWTLAWDDKSYGCYALMAQLTGQQTYQADTERWLDYWSTGYNGDQITYSPGGQAHLSTWGSLRYASNTAFVALLYSEVIASSNPTKSETYRNFGIDQINYALGSNPNNRSYVCGFGNNPPINPHHRTAHGSWANSIGTPTDNRHILYGALVGGPSSANDEYTDDRGDYIANEVATDYNAGFTGAIANLVGRFGGTILNDFPQSETYDVCEEYFNEAKINASGNTFTEVAVWATNHSAWPATETKEVCFRYFVDISEGIDAGYSAEDYTMSINTAPSGTTVSDLTQWEGTIYYVEVCFPNTNIYPGGQSESGKEAQLRVALPNNAPSAAWDPTNDWSYYIADNNPLNNGLQSNPRIPFYNNGELLCGELPEGGNQNSNPIANIVANPTSGDSPLLVSFSAFGSYDPNDGDDLTFTWDFGDGHTHPGTSTYHTFVTPGIHLVTMTVDDGNGGTATATVNITVIDATPQPPTAVIEANPTNGGYPLTVEFDGSGSTDPNADDLTYSWNFGDGNTATGAMVNHTYTTIGIYTATLTVDDGGNGGSDTETVTIEVTNTVPNAVFTATTTAGIPPLAVTFDAASSSDENGDNLTYSWDFGDSNTSSGVTASHTYTNEGTYTVTLTVTDENGASDVATTTISVRLTTCNLSLKYRTYDNSIESAVDNQIRAHFMVENSGDESLNLQDITIRYWYTNEGNVGQQAWVDYATIGNSNITTNFVEMANPVSGADHYFEVGFTAGAGTLAIGEDSGEIQTRFAKTDWSNYDENDDYSYNMSHNSFQTWDKVTVYCDGILAWGTEPGDNSGNTNECDAPTMDISGTSGEGDMESDTYQAATTITSDGVIESGTSINFKSGGTIILKVGFHAKAGCEFSASIESCVMTLQAPLPISPQAAKEIPIAALNIAPNPLSDFTNLYFNLPESNSVYLMVTNGFGQLLATPINQVLYDKGEHTFTLNTADYLSGIYFVHFRFENKWITKKILVVK